MWSIPSLPLLPWPLWVVVHIKRHTYSKGYNHWKWNWWSEFKFWTRLFVFPFLLISCGKAWIRLFLPLLWANTTVFFSLYTVTSLVWVGWVLWHINHCRLFNAKSSLYIYIKYIWFGLVGFYVTSTLVGYLMPNSLYTYISNIYIWFCFAGFYGISTIVDYLMPNPLYTYMSNIYDSVFLGFMSDQLL